MHLRRLQNSIRCSPQSFLSGLLVFLLLAASGAIPSTKVVVRPVDRVAHTADAHAAEAHAADARPFPCQGHRCGCTSVEECGERCCCFSPAQLADWYEQHADEQHAAECEAVRSPPSLDCCAEQPEELAQDVANDVANDAHVVTIPISLDAARRCQGLSTLWLLLAQALPADSTPLWQFDESTTATIDVYAALRPQVVVRPDIPPPRA